MANLGFEKMVIIFVVALIVLGPEKLPGAMHKLGQAVAQFRRLAEGFEDEIKSAMNATVEPSTGPPATGEPTGGPGIGDAAPPGEVPAPNDDSPLKHGR